MKYLLILSLVLFSCRQKVVYIREGKTDTVVSVDFNVEKDKWVNEVINNETGIKKVDGFIGFRHVGLNYKSVYLSWYEINPQQYYGIMPDGEMFMFQRDNSSTVHRVSEITYNRIKKLLQP